MMWSDYGFHEGWGGMRFGMFLFWILLVVVLVVILGPVRANCSMSATPGARSIARNTKKGAPTSIAEACARTFRGRAVTERAARCRPPQDVRSPDESARSAQRRLS
jgi:hypothetical protein